MSEGKDYVPELGQMTFGQPWQAVEAPGYLVYFLRAVEAALYDRALEEHDGVVWSSDPGFESWSTPFENSGETFVNNTFEAHAYSWGNEDQPFNFKWRDLRVSWYKWLGRGTTVNRPITTEEAAEMAVDCLRSLEDQGEATS